MSNSTAAQPLDLDKLINALRFHGRYGTETEDQARMRRYNERQNAAAAIESLIAQARTARLGTTSSAVCVACEGKPSAQNNPCAVCGRATLAPVAAQQAAAKAPAAQADVFESMSMDEVIASGIKRGRQAEAADWAECERISDLPAVDEALRGFSEDPTGDNGTMIVRAVLEALAASPAIPPEASQQADDEWDRNAERLTREMGIGGGRINPDATSIDNLFIDDEDEQAAAVAAPEKLAGKLTNAVIAVGHIITDESVILHRNPQRSGNALRQLEDRIKWALPRAPATATSEDARDAALEEAANAVASTNTLGMTAASAITKLCANIRALKSESAMRANQQEGGNE